MNKITQTVLAGSRNYFKKIAVVCCLFFLVGGALGQTTVTIGGGATVSCPAVPTATYSPAVTGVSFSNWSRGSGVTCSSVASALTGTNFLATTVTGAAGVTANKFYSISISTNATTSFTLSGITWLTAVSASAGTVNFALMYSNNGGSVTQFGLTGTSQTTNSFSGSSVIVAANTTIILYFVPLNVAATTGTVRLINGSTITGTASTTTTSEPNLSITPATTNLGSSCVGVAISSVQYTITNSGTVAASGVTVTSTGTNSGDFVVSGLSSTAISASGGTATYNVTFTPSSTGARAATITTASSTTGSNSPTTALTGTGTATTAPTVTSSAATIITAKTATLNGNVTNIGGCPSITEKGFVYAITSVNATPTDSGTGVTKQAVAGIATGAFTFGLINLPSSTQYSFRSYVFDGTTYVYGNVLTFTTSAALVLTGTLAHGSVCPTLSTTPITYTITNNGATSADGISVGSSNAEFAVSGLSSTTIAPSGTATYQVTFTPATAGAKTATVTVSSSTAASATNALTGTGTAPTAPTVTSNAATTITAKTATLNGNVTNIGVCPSITEKGFVYAITSVNATPTDSGTEVTKQAVAGIATGVFTFGLINLPSSTQYSFRSYVFDGTTYVYGNVLTFTTSAALVLTGTLAHGSGCPTLSTTPITYTITNNGATSADGISVGSSNAEFAVSGLSPTTIAPSGTATYQVTFTPATAGGKTATVTVSSANAASATNALTGTGTTPVSQSVATTTAITVTTTTAQLRAISVTFGTCPSTSVKGFVYALTTANNNPEIGGVSVTNVAVTPLGTAGNYNSSLTGLTSGVSYSYKAYLFNGTTYTYGVVQTFTTFSPPSNDDCVSATTLVVNAAATTGNLAFASQSITAISCSASTGNANDDVWYAFTTSTAGNYTITADGGASLDLVLDVREGACNGTNIGCADSTSSGVETLVLSLAASTTYYFRAYDFGATNFITSTIFTVQIAANSSLSSNGVTILNFVNQHITTNSIGQTFNVSGQFLTGFPGVVTVASSNADFQVSADNSTWNSSITLPYASDQLASVPVYARFTPQSTGAKTANITLSGGGATPVIVALEGTGIFVATAATNIMATSFNANWQVVQNASNGYLLDVSTLSNFGNASVIFNQGFEAVTFPPTGWLATGWARSTATGDVNSGLAAAVAGFNNGNLTTVAVANPTSMSFFLGRTGNTTAKTLTIEISTTNQTTGFVTVATFDHSNVPSASYNQYTVDLSAYSAQSVVFIRFVKTSSTTSPWRLDDLVVNAGAASFVPGYNAKPIAGQTTITSSVTGLTPETQYYYRLRAVNGVVESGNSNTISVTTTAPITSTTWITTAPATIPAWTNGAPTALINAIIAEDYDETAAITAKNLTVNATKVLTIQSANTLVLAGNLTNNGSIIFKSNALGTASFAEYTGAAIAGTGTTTVERFIPARRAWRLLTAPLRGSTSNSIFANWQNNGAAVANTTGLLLWNPAGTATPSASGNGLFLGLQPNIRSYTNGAFQNVNNSNATLLFTATENNPFLVFVTGPHANTATLTGTALATTARATGTLVTGTVTKDLNANQFTLIGNPYASPINPASLIDSNSGAKLWLINPSTGVGAYVTFDGNWSIPPDSAADGYIQSGQGFFARTVLASTFTINETNKVTGNSNNWFAKNASAAAVTESVDKIRVLLYKQEASNWTIADGILSVNQASGSNEVDGKDAGKISNFNESLMFRNNTSNLSIEYRSLPQTGEIQPLRMTGTVAIPYQFRVYTEEYTNSTLQPYLQDTQAGILTAIPMDGTQLTVPFTGMVSTTTNPDNRFRIVYQTNLNTVETSPLVVSIFPNPVINNQLNIHLGNNTNTADYSITNLLGQSIQKGQLATTQNVITLSSASQGFYILSIKQDGKSFTTKIYVH